MIRKILLSALLVFSFAVVPVASVSAAQVDVLGTEVCDRQPDATVCKEGASAKNDNPIYGPNGILTKVINILSIIVGIAAVLGIMAAGLKFITSGSNPQQVTAAREMVLYAVVGLIVAALAQAMVRFVLSKL